MNNSYGIINSTYWEIDKYLYDPKKKEWQYTTKIFDRKFYEDELELVEEGVENV